jgi:hypothetical protein
MAKLIVRIIAARIVVFREVFGLDGCGLEVSVSKGEGSGEIYS